MRNCEVSQEMSAFYFGLAVFCLFEARVPEFDMKPLANFLDDKSTLDANSRVV
jgi:hypothetical protein